MVNGLELEAGIQMANATEARARGTRRCTLRDHATDMAMSTPSTAFAHSHGGLIEESELSFFLDPELGGLGSIGFSPHC